MDTQKDKMLEQMQNEQLRLLMEFDRVCKELKLKYSLAWGTCLGAIRHEGFIPWDDDIDVYMYVDELELLHKHSDLFDEGFFLQNVKSDPEYGLMISRLRNSNTTLIEKEESDRDINHGIFIDIYPLFNAPKGKLKAKKQLIDSFVYRLLLYGKAPVNRGKVMNLGSKLVLSIVPEKARKGIMSRCYKEMNKYNYTGYITPLYGRRYYSKFPVSWFFPTKRVKFEDVELPVMANPEEYLKYVFGDYMQLPPIEKRTVHHNYIKVDTEESYSKYKGVLYCKE